MTSKAEWVALIEAFVAGRMNGPEFETAFLDRTRAATDAGESVPYAVDLLFYEMDAYCADPALRGEHDLDEAGLREAASRLLARIDEPWPPVPGAPNETQQMQAFRAAVARLRD